MQKLMILGAVLTLGSACAVAGQFEVGMFPLKIAGQKAIIKLELVNHLAEPVSSAKAACFISDESGQVLARSARWVFGGSTTNTASIPVSGTNIFNFVVNSTKPWTTTNLSAKLVFSRIVLKSGALADPLKDLQVSSKK